jgi:hypothetical protein
MPDFLRFGIPSLDQLIGSFDGNFGVEVTRKDGGRTVTDATGVCIMGPDGTGKSVFALHLASHYLADCLDERNVGDGLNPFWFRANDIKTLSGIVETLRKQESKTLQSKFQPGTRRLLQNYKDSSSVEPLRQALVAELNRLLLRPDLPKLVKNQQGEEIAAMLRQSARGNDLTENNRAFLEEMYPHELAKRAEIPKVYYISTDLTHGKAKKIWTNFGLDKPFDRTVPFEDVDYAALRTSDLTDIPKLVEKLRLRQDLLSQHLFSKLSEHARKLIEDLGSVPSSKLLRDSLVDELNQILKNDRLFQRQRFAGTKISKAVRNLTKVKLQGKNLVSVNRLLLQQAYPEEIKTTLKGTDLHLELSRHLPDQVVDYIQSTAPSVGSKAPHSVCFIDLAETTAGDDWGFVNRLLALTQTPRIGHPKPLFIMDAVEGFEAYGGRLDAFGEASSRRARIAQLARLAAGKAHVVLIVEEMRSMQRLPEEFVADVVIRLRNVEVNKYLRRTVEIEKARGQSLVRGQHPFSIRKGAGSTTGSQINSDDPEILVSADHKENEVGVKAEALDENNTPYPYQDYVQVFPSLNYLNRAIMEVTHAPRNKHPEHHFAGFGIRYLDNMLGGDGLEANRIPDRDGDHDTRGLPCGSVTALIGDSLTQKTRLGRAFLSRCFYPFRDPDGGFRTVVESLRKKQFGSKSLPELLEEIVGLKKERETAGGLRQQIHRDLSRLKRQVVDAASEGSSKTFLQRCGVALLFANQDTHHEQLAEDFLIKELGVEFNNDPNKHEQLIAEILVESRVICRRTEIHDVPASILSHIFEQNIRSAQDILARGTSHPSERFLLSKRIRVVFDDFSAFRNTYKEVREDPLFLPYLLFSLGREGVTALIIDTQSFSRPDLTLTERYESELRELVQHRLYTWRVPFYGDNRVAITAIPPFSPGTSGAIRELRWEGSATTDTSGKVNRSLQVNPQFELYSGLEDGKPQPVPIEIRFYAESEAFHRYLDAEEVRFAELFVPYKRENQAGSPRVMFSYGPEGYDVMRDFCGLQRGTRLDHTLVFQLDEFWTGSRPRTGRTGAFRPQWNYLTTPTWDAELKRDAVADPYGVYQPTQWHEQRKQWKGARKKELLRLDFYDGDHVPYVEQCKNTIKDESVKSGIDRIPLSWDFGFLLCKERAWRDAYDDEVFRDKAKEENNHLRRLRKPTVGKNVRVGQIWESLTKATYETPEGKAVGWFEFLGACKRVAEHQSHKTPSVAHTFDFSVFSPETFPCLLLEVWASEILKDNRIHKARFIDQLSRRRLSQQPSSKLCADDLSNPGRLVRKLQRDDPLSQYIFSKLAATQKLLQAEQSSEPSDSLGDALADDLNRLIRDEHFEQERFAQVKLKPETLALKNQEPKNNAVAHLNWSLLADAFQGEIARPQRRSLPEWLANDAGLPLETCLKRRQDPLRGFSLEFYKTWLLMIEAIDFSELIRRPDAFPLGLKPRQVSSSVVAARHWYKTASQFIESISAEELEANWVPVRLPGHFSTRGDWFLTVAGGSRSSRLADRALDLLSSKRANIDRLHEGIGLPVRRLYDDNEECHLRTPLIAFDTKQLTKLPYQDLLTIGVNKDQAARKKEGFHWLWRSNLYGYNNDLRIWHRWISQTIVWWHSLRLKYASSWTSGFELYARLERLQSTSPDTEENKKSLALLRTLDSWNDFHKRVKTLVDSLRQVSIGSD